MSTRSAHKTRLLIEDVWNERPRTAGWNSALPVNPSERELCGSREARHDQRASRRREAFLTIMLLLIAAVAFVIMDKWIVPLSRSGHGLL
jgi:hypothetical protein